MSIIEDLKHMDLDNRCLDLEQMVTKTFSYAIAQLLVIIRETTSIINNELDNLADPYEEWYEYIDNGVDTLLTILTLNLKTLNQLNEDTCKEYIKKLTVLMGVINDKKQLLHGTKDLDVFQAH